MCHIVLENERKQSDERAELRRIKPAISQVSQPIPKRDRTLFRRMRIVVGSEYGIGKKAATVTAVERKLKDAVRQPKYLPKRDSCKRCGVVIWVPAFPRSRIDGLYSAELRVPPKSAQKRSIDSLYMIL
jgi:hypothetical protein